MISPVAGLSTSNVSSDFARTHFPLTKQASRKSFASFKSFKTMSVFVAVPCIFFSSNARLRHLLSLRDGREARFDHVQSFFELRIGHDQRHQYAHHIPVRSRRNVDQPMLVTIPGE